MDINTLGYTESHEWVHLDGDTATIGISDFAVKELTDLVFIELPAIGSSLTAGSSFGEVESVKAVSDLNAPISGEVIAVNEELPGQLGWLSDDPFGTGWIAKIKVTDATQFDALMTREQYQKFYDEHSH